MNSLASQTRQRLRTEDALAFAHWHVAQEGAPGSLHIERLALTLEQAVAHDLLDTDGNAEIDGLPVPVLDALSGNGLRAALTPISSVLSSKLRRRCAGKPLP
jgi:hypothetical protein